MRLPLTAQVSMITGGLPDRNAFFLGAVTIQLWMAPAGFIWSAAATTPLFLRFHREPYTIPGKAASLPPHSK